MDSKPSSSIRSSRIPRIALPALLFALLLVAVYTDPLLTRRNFVGRDLVPFGLPLEKSVHDAWSRGRIPVWSEDVSGGRPLVSNPSAGAFYPLRLLLSRLPFPDAMRVFPVVQWIIGSLGMFLALRALGVSSPGGWVGAATFVFSGVSISNSYYTPLLPSATLLPWVLWASARPARGLGGRAVPLGAVFGLLGLLGDAFGFAVGLLVALLWIAAETPRGERTRALGALAAGLVLGGLLAAPQIAATALVVPETHRAVSGFTVREAVAFTLSPWRLLELVVPFPFGPFWSLDDREAWGSAIFRPFFATMYCGTFAVVAFVALRRNTSRGARFARVLVVAGAGLAIVFRFVPPSLLDRRSPVPLRFPEKFATAVVLGFAVLAGLAVDRFRDPARRPSWLLWCAAGLAAAAIAAFFFPEPVGAAAARATGAPTSLALEIGRTLSGAFAEAGLLGAITLVAIDLFPRGRTAVLVAVALLTLAPIAANRRIARTVNEAAIFPPTAFARTIARRDPRSEFRTVDATVFPPASPLALVPKPDVYRTEQDRQEWCWAAPVLWDRGMVLNLDPDFGDLSRLWSLRRISGEAARNPAGAPFFEALSLRFGIRYRDQRPLPGFRRFGGSAFHEWDENPDALPDVRLIERWREEPGAIPALQALPALAAGEVVVETDRSGRGEARPGRVTVVEKSPETLVLDVESPDPSWLFVLRGYWNHRRIRVDGREADAVPAQLAFSAVPVAAGTHRIEWTEEAPGFSVSRWGPVLFAFVAAGLLVRRPEAAAA